MKQLSATGAFILVTLWVQISAAAVVVVNPGDTIQVLVDANPEGTTFNLKAGLYRNQSITAKSGDIFIGETGTILSGARVLTDWKRSGAVWYVTGQTQHAPPSENLCLPSSPRCSFSEDVFFNDVLKVHAASLADVVPGKWFFDYDAQTIYVGDDPSAATVETSVAPWAFTGAVTGVTIRHLIIEKYAGFAIGAQSTFPTPEHWVIEDNEIRFNHDTGIWNFDGDIARRNHVHHNGCQAFGGYGTNILVENNELAYNNTVGNDPFMGCGGAKWVYTDHLIVRGNHSHHNDGPGLWTDINNSYTLYENNLVEDNRRGGIFHELGYSAVIRGNLSRRNGTGHDYPGWTTGAGIEILDAPNVEVYGNTVVDNWQGITCLDDGRSDPPNETDGPHRMVNFNVHDNVVVQMADLGEDAGRTGCIALVNGTFTTGSNRYAGNTYYLGFDVHYFMWAAGSTGPDEWVAGGEDTDGKIYRGVTPVDLTAPLLSAITASFIGSNLTVSWTTDEAATTQVLVGLTTASAQTPLVGNTLTTTHSTSFSDLHASTVYHYQVRSKDASGNLAASGDLTFTTPDGLFH